MPTGYTSAVYDGNTSLRDYILRCSRGMGFTITMRDDALDTPLPESFQPDGYHRDRMDQARRLMYELDALPTADCAVRAQAEYDKAVEAREDVRADYAKRRVSYETVIEQAEAWDCPEKLASLKTFMLEQLQESYRFDVHDIDTPGGYWKEPVLKSPEMWKVEAIEKAAKDVRYHTEEWEKEQARTADRNGYLEALRECLPEPVDA